MSNFKILSAALIFLSIISLTACKPRIPAGWPSDLPIMPGFDVSGRDFNRISADEANGFINATGRVPVQEVVDFYKKLPDWSFTDIPGCDPGGACIEASKGNRRVQIVITIATTTEYSGFGRYYFKAGDTYLEIDYWEASQ